MDNTDIKEKARYAFVREKAKDIKHRPPSKALAQKPILTIREAAEEKQEETEAPTPAEQMMRLGQETAQQAVYRSKEMRFTVKRISPVPSPEPMRQQKTKAISLKEKPADFSAGEIKGNRIKIKQEPVSLKTASTPNPKANAKAVEQGKKKLRQRAAQHTHKTAKTAAAISRKVADAMSKAAAAVSGASIYLTAGAVLLGVLFLAAIGGFFASPAGIVVGGGADGTPTIPEVIQIMDAELSDKISHILTSSGEVDDMYLSYNGVDSCSYIRNLPDIVAVFAVKAGMDETEAVDVLTMDTGRIRIFRDVFWDMVSVSSLLTETVVEGEELDVNDVPIPVTKRRLDVRIDTKGWQDMLPSLNPQQQEMLALLMEEPMFSMIQAMCGSNSMLTLTPEQIAEMESYLPENLDPLRRKIVETAWSLVGKIGYFWGGKSEVIGWDTRWGVPTIVTSTGNDAYGTVRPFGLDCSGFVTWVMINATEDPGAVHHIGHGTSNQWGNSMPISWNEAQPGDLVFVSPGWAADNHVGIVVGRNATGKLMVCHCTGEGVVISTAAQFNSVRRIYHDFNLN